MERGNKMRIYGMAGCKNNWRAVGIKVASLADAVLACQAIFPHQRDNARHAIREERLRDKHLQGRLALRANELRWSLVFMKDMSKFWETTCNWPKFCKWTVIGHQISEIIFKFVSFFSLGCPYFFAMWTETAHLRKNSRPFLLCNFIVFLLKTEHQQTCSHSHNKYNSNWKTGKSSSMASSV